MFFMNFYNFRYIFDFFSVGNLREHLGPIAHRIEAQFKFLKGITVYANDYILSKMSIMLLSPLNITPEKFAKSEDNLYREVTQQKYVFRCGSRRPTGER